MSARDSITPVHVRTGRDCFDACLASLFGLRLEEIESHEGEDWLERYQQDLFERGFILTDALVGAFAYVSGRSDPSGSSPGHAVIAADGETIHDPGENWPDFDAAEWPEGFRIYVHRAPAWLAKREKERDELLAEARAILGDLYETQGVPMCLWNRARKLLEKTEPTE